MSELSLIAVDIGASRVRVGVGHDPTPGSEIATPESGDALLDAVAQLIDREAAGSHSYAVGIACPGLVRPQGFVERALYVPLTGVDLPEALSRRLGPRHVAVVNDADAQALGAARSNELLLYVALGSAVGGSIVAEGQIWRGAGPAGEIGHTVVRNSSFTCTCGRVGCLDTVASGNALDRDLESEWYAIGHPDERQVLERAGDAVGQAIVNCIVLLSPHRVLLGGHLAARQSFKSAVSRVVESCPWGETTVEFTDATWPLTTRGLNRVLRSSPINNGSSQ